MKTKINKIFNQIEDWDSEDLERLISEIESLLETKEIPCMEGTLESLNNL